VFKCISARLLFEEFSQINLKLWGGHLWSDDYIYTTIGDVSVI